MSRRHYFKPMLSRWESVETILLLTAPPSVTPIFLVKALSTPGVVQLILTDNYHWIRRNVIKFKKSVQEAISRDNLTTKRVCMFSRRAWGYIIAYKLMIHKQTIAGLGIDLFTHICVKIIYIMVKYFNTCRCMLGFGALFFSLPVKEKRDKKHLFIIYKSPSSQDLEMYL